MRIQILKPRAKLTKGAIAVELLSQAMMAMALGVLCAGLLLWTRQIDLNSFIKVPQPWLGRLIFLLSIGLGAALGRAVVIVARVFEIDRRPQRGNKE
jgi:hypothetical protein